MTLYTSLMRQFDNLPVEHQQYLFVIGMVCVCAGALALAWIAALYLYPWLDRVWPMPKLQRQDRGHSASGVRETATGRGRGEHSAFFAASSFNGQDSGPSIRGSEFDSPRRYQRDPLLFRDQVREDMRRSLRVIPSNRVRKEQ